VVESSQRMIGRLVACFADRHVKQLEEVRAVVRWTPGAAAPPANSSAVQR